jgi:hypothetical protein
MVQHHRNVDLLVNRVKPVQERGNGRKPLDGLDVYVIITVTYWWGTFRLSSVGDLSPVGPSLAAHLEGLCGVYCGQAARLADEGDPCCAALLPRLLFGRPESSPKSALRVPQPASASTSRSQPSEHARRFPSFQKVLSRAVPLQRGRPEAAPQRRFRHPADS